MAHCVLKISIQNQIKRSGGNVYRAMNGWILLYIYHRDLNVRFVLQERYVLESTI